MGKILPSCAGNTPDRWEVWMTRPWQGTGAGHLLLAGHWRVRDMHHACPQHMVQECPNAHPGPVFQEKS